MEHKSLFDTLEDSFEFLNPYEKGLFIDARLAWASGGKLCDEVRIRICNPLNDE